MNDKILFAILDQLNLNEYIEAQIHTQLLFGRRNIDEDDIRTSKFIMDQLNARQGTINKLMKEVYKGEGVDE